MEQNENLNGNVYKDSIKKWDISWLGVIRYIVIPLVASLLGALIASQYTLYNVKYSIQETRRQSLRNDISMLKIVDTELERNLSFLLQNRVYIPVVDFNEINVEKDVERFINGQFKDNNQRANYDRNLSREVIIAFIKGSYTSPIAGMQIGQTQIPDQYFLVGAWFGIRRVSSEIDFDVIKIIDDLYIKIDKINNDISYVDKMVNYYSIVHFNNVNRIRLAIKSIENNLAAISKDEIQNVKNKIRDEIVKLKKDLDKFS
jgi:hypothetical protein